MSILAIQECKQNTALTISWEHMWNANLEIL